MALVEIVGTSGLVSEGTSPCRTSDPLQRNIPDVSDLFGLQHRSHCSLRRRTIRHLYVLAGTARQIGRDALLKKRGVTQHDNRSIVLRKQAQSLLKTLHHERLPKRRNNDDLGLAGIYQRQNKIVYVLAVGPSVDHSTDDGRTRADTRSCRHRPEAEGP